MSYAHLKGVDQNKENSLKKDLLDKLAARQQSPLSISRAG
ncbi:hypothetical protein KR50_17180 [Jeotgalibacillus campisalis]|uniref:Uncharacterized protein n=1 Tax=Jeotgalibacillus campisalis TaxID=220754 RepID=A0A0C2VT01_9BACL|nr:hypothetical protein KR50_17180 [Jeotgalibacillus campisalis]